jgi:hypothetical protein
MNETNTIYPIFASIIDFATRISVLLLKTLNTLITTYPINLAAISVIAILLILHCATHIFRSHPQVKQMPASATKKVQEGINELKRSFNEVEG